MKNQQKIAMYIAIGALAALVLLFLTGRLRTERYEAATEQELLDFLEEVETSPTEEVPEDMMGPAPMGEGEDSDEEE
jgi:hypothetical protein